MMTLARHRDFWARMERGKLLLWGVGAVVAIIGALWTTFAEPRIDCKIDDATRPIEDAVVFQTYLIMETMDSTRVRVATEKFKMFETYGRGKILYK